MNDASQLDGLKEENPHQYRELREIEESDE